MNFKVIYLYGLPASLNNIFRSAFPERQICALNSEGELKASIENIEVIFVFRPPRGVWSGAKRLRLIQTAGAGVDSVLPAPDLPQEVRITNARGVAGNQMAEHALTMMLAFAKQLPKAIENQGSRRWERYVPTSLVDKNCSIIGLGAIGRVVAERARQFGMRVIGIQRKPKNCVHADEVLPPEHTDRALREADYVVVILPLTPKTRNFMNGALLLNMKQDAVLINISRGGIVDETTVANMLREGRLRGAAFDVFQEEPLPESSNLWTVPNLIITPHVAGGVPDYMERILEIFIDNVRRLENGEPLRNEIDRSRGY
jgi:phosphoglycerate dehydrogenase-like enzyme